MSNERGTALIMSDENEENISFVETCIIDCGTAHELAQMAFTLKRAGDYLSKYDPSSNDGPEILKCYEVLKILCAKRAGVGIDMNHIMDIAINRLCE